MARRLQGGSEAGRHHHGERHEDERHGYAEGRRAGRAGEEEVAAKRRTRPHAPGSLSRLRERVAAKRRGEGSVGRHIAPSTGQAALRKHARAMRCISTDAEQQALVVAARSSARRYQVSQTGALQAVHPRLRLLRAKIRRRSRRRTARRFRTDPRRDALLRAEGFQVARYWNNDVLRNPEGVLTDLLNRLTSK